MRQISYTANRFLQSTRLNQEFVARFLIITGLLFLSTVQAFQTPTPGGRIALLLLSAVPAALLVNTVLANPPVGLLIMMVSGLLIPFSFGPLSVLNPTIVLSALSLSLWAFNIITKRRQTGLLQHRPILILLLLSGSITLSFIVGQLPWFQTARAPLDAQVAGTAVFILSFGVFITAADQLDRRWLSRLTYLFLLTGTLIIVGRLSIVGVLTSRLLVTGALGSVFWIWLISLSAGLAIFNHDLRWPIRLWLAAITIGGFSIGFRNLIWASGWAPPLLSLLILVWLRLPRIGWIAFLVALVVAIVNYEPLLLIVAGENQGNLYSWETRQIAWRIPLQIVRSSPILGFGPANYYYFVQGITIPGWDQYWNVRFSSHSNYVDLIVQTGILGTTLFLTFVSSILSMAWRYHRVKLADGFSRAYIAATFAGTIATLASGFLGDWFIPFVYNIGLPGMRASILFWLFMGGFLSLIVETQKTEAEDYA